jgi:hypothetical protein
LLTGAEEFDHTAGGGDNELGEIAWAMEEEEELRRIGSSPAWEIDTDGVSDRLPHGGGFGRIGDVNIDGSHRAGLETDPKPGVGRPER